MRLSLVSALAALCSFQCLYVQAGPIKRQSIVTADGKTYTNNAGVFPEWTSIAGSLFGEATSKLVSAVAGIDAFETYQGASSTPATWAEEPAPTQEPATWSSESQDWAESQWLGATDAVGGAWSSYASAYDSAASSASPINRTSSTVAVATSMTVPTSSTTGAGIRKVPSWMKSILFAVPLVFFSI